MNQLNFWITWTSINRRLLLIIAAFSFIALGLVWIAYFQAPSAVIPTEHYQQLETQEIALHSFTLGGVKLTITGDNYSLFEYLKGGIFTPNPFAAYVFVGLLAISMVILLSIITTLNRFWYSVGMGLFILFIVGFRLESTLLVNLSNKIPTIVVLLVFNGLSFYFHAFNRNVNFQIRLITFFGLTLLFAMALIFFSSAKDPFMHLAANGMVAGILLSIVFIFTVAHEILAFFINVITQGTKQTNSLRHFSIISTIYLINLALTYADKKGFLNWNFLSINLFLLLTISALLGFWGFRQRERLYSTILSANPLGCYLFLSLAVACFATINYLVTNANDPALQLIQDAILYGHLGYGIIFLCYILANFTSMLANNQQVYKILYNPNSMPYFTFRLGGLIATYAFFAYSVYTVSIHQFFAGYFNATGDAYSLSGDLPFAESYYEQALLYTNRNHHARYALASMEVNRLELKKEKKQYEKAADTRASELSYLNLSLAYERDKENLLANNILIQGLKDYPSSGKLENALGLSYASLGIKDSALLFLQKAKERAGMKGAAETNLIGLLVRFKLPYPADSLFKLISTTEKGAKTNAFALANQQAIHLEMETPKPTDTVINVYEATLLSNYIFNRLNKIDTLFLNSVISLARRPSNKYYKSSLLEAVAQGFYANGNLNKAFNLLSENAFIERSGKLHNTLGLWALEQGNPELAFSEFNAAIDDKYEKASIGKALALSEIGNQEAAKINWVELATSTDSTFKDIATSFLKIYNTSLNKVDQLNDEQKYQLAHFTVDLNDSVRFLTIVKSITDPNLKAHAILDRCKKLFKNDLHQEAANLIVTLHDIELKDKLVYNQLLEFNLQLLAAARDLNALKNQLTNLPEEAITKTNKIYFEALLENRDGNTLSAKEKFLWLSHSNPFNEEATLDGINAVKTLSNDKLKAFNLLVGAISANPGSVKLTKAYIIEAAKLGFDEYAQEALDKLEVMVSPSYFKRFVKANPEVFQVIPN